MQDAKTKIYTDINIIDINIISYFKPYFLHKISLYGITNYLDTEKIIVIHHNSTMLISFCYHGLYFLPVVIIKFIYLT